MSGSYGLHAGINARREPVTYASGEFYRYPAPHCHGLARYRRAPAVYRWLVVDAPTGTMLKIYVGETENM